MFTDVDQPDGSWTGARRSNRRASTRIQYFDRNGRADIQQFRSGRRRAMEACPSSASCLTTPASRRSVIKTGDVAPGPNDDRHHDIVMMDDFIYGEPQLLQ